MKQKGLFRVRNIILSLVFFMLMYILINFKPFGLAKLHELTNGHSILDMEMQGYSADRAYEILEALGPEGRAYDLNTIIPLDFLFPVSYAFFYFVTLTYLAKRHFPLWKKPWAFGVIGLLAGLFDWMENIMIVRMLKNHPTRLNAIADTANVMTRLKSGFILLSMMAILAGLILLVLRRNAFRRP